MAGGPPPRKPWLTKKFLKENPLKIQFNDLLTDEEHDWFIELVIAGLYPGLSRIKELSEILKDWNWSNHPGKLEAVRLMFVDIWELKVAFNYMLPIGAENLAFPLSPNHLKQKNRAFNNEVFIGRYGTRQKIRMILTRQVEMKALGNGSYKKLLHAFYIYRSFFKYDYGAWLEPHFVDCEAREFCALIVDTGVGPDVDGSKYEGKRQALTKFVKYFKTYVYQAYNYKRKPYDKFNAFALMWLMDAMAHNTPVYDQGPGMELADGRDPIPGILLHQKCYPHAYDGERTPFQILLGNVCWALSIHSADALLDFKQHLLNFSCFTQSIINIGIEEGIIWDERQRR